MAKTTAVYPAIVAPYVQLAMVENNNLLTQGVVTIDTSPPLTKSGERFQIPFQYSMNTHTGMEKITATTTVTPLSLDDGSIYVPAVERGAGITSTEYESIKRGLNANQQLGTQIGQFVAEDTQDRIKAVLNGVFHATNGVLTASNVYDGTGTGHISYSLIGYARRLLGEQGTKLDSIIVHSYVYQDMYENGLVTVPATQYADSIIRTGLIPTFVGLKVIVNDTICAPEGVAVPATEYPSFLTGGQPLYLGYQKNLRVYKEFDPALGGGTESIYFYIDYGVGVKGVSYSSSTMNPTDAVLGTAASYTKIEQTKNIKIVKLLTGATS